MNHIYKVVWSKVRGCYIVVSEIAKSNGKSRSLKAAVLGAVFMGTVLITGAGSLNPVEAATGYTGLGGTINTDNSIAVGTNTAAGNTATSTPAAAIGENAEATGKYSIAIGFGVQESEDSVTKTTASGESAVSIGTDTNAANQHSIAIGSHTSATADSTVSIGYDTHVSAASAVAIGSGSKHRR